MKKNILILGGTGLLGGNLLSGPYLQNYSVVTLGRSLDSDFKIDLLDKAAIVHVLDLIKPTTIINLAGLTDVDHCEKFPNDAYKVNVKILQILVNAISEISFNPFLIHISTDQVYDGKGPFSETDVNLCNYYAFSKYCGELIARKTNSIVLRTNFIGKSLTPKRSSLSDWVFKNLISEQNFMVFEDVKFSPLSMGTLCEFIVKAIPLKIEGVFNIGSHNGMSKADFAFYFANKLNLNTTKMKQVKVSEVNFLNTYRPRDMRLNLSKFENTFSFNLPQLTEEIETIVKEYK